MSGFPPENYHSILKLPRLKYVCKFLIYYNIQAVPYTHVQILVLNVYVEFVE